MSARSKAAPDESVLRLMNRAIGKLESVIVIPKLATMPILKGCGRLGQSEGWLVVFDPDLTKPWDAKISTEDVSLEGKTIHIVRC